ncbi:hypothetical protein PGIGA_G00183000 [Pangasianodon gigas]|uniref:Uncharacterized protein n=1 Tax=Pangasianodon gigas TaxID=30993 RepID=A0ACC5WA96_PANGG|nr:hypothetical protein [Pangasianodon gigas]
MQQQQQLSVPSAVLLLLLLLLCGTAVSSAGLGESEPETPDWRKTLKTIRNGIHKIDTYLNYALDLIGGSDGLCQFKCSDGYKPIPRPHYKHSPPNGCGSPLFGFHFDIGIPSMTRCCNQHDRCYDTCGREKHNCDDQFQVCLETICRNFDIGIPSMTRCCNQHDRCYDTCGREKHDCDDQFQVCLETICRNVQTTLGLDQSVQACESAVTLLFDAVMHLGCKPYLDSQRAACICRYEEKTDL